MSSNQQGSKNNQFPPWKDKHLDKNWALKSAQNVNSPEYKQLKKYIHMPYRKVDNSFVKCYYFPTYPIFKIKNITQFDFESLSARINGVLIIKIRVDYEDKFTVDQNKLDQADIRRSLQNLFGFSFKDTPKIVGEEANLDEKPKNYLYVQFNRDNPLRLPSKRIFEGQIKKDFVDETYVVWTIRKEFTISLAPGTISDDLIAPFNTLNFKLSLTFEDVDVTIKKNDGSSETVKFKFNCMKRVGNSSEEEQKKVFEQLSFTDDGSLGEYDLAEKKLSVYCDKFRSEQTQNDDSNQYKSFKVITFTIPFYKYPIMDSLTIFIPLVLITILTLFTFVQGPDYNDKIGNIATLMIVYVGLVPVISDSLPPTTSLTLIDLVVYFQLIINVLCLIRGYIIKDYDTTQFTAYKIWQDPLFIISFSIAILTGIILISLLIYYCIMKKYFFNLEEADIDEGEKKMLYWVSPHMYGEARNIKTEIEKIDGEIKAAKSNADSARATNSQPPNHLDGPPNSLKANSKGMPTTQTLESDFPKRGSKGK